MTNPALPTPPATLSVTLARQLVSRSEVVPTALLLAASAVLRAASREVVEDVCAHLRRRGNRAKRLQAQSDARVADDVEKDLELRWGLLGALNSIAAPGQEPGAEPVLDEVAGHEWVDAARRMAEVEGMPALGPNQWRVITAVADTWRHSIDELVTMARATYPDEIPLDVEPWRSLTYGIPSEQQG